MPSVSGNTHGLKKSELARLEKLYRRKLPPDSLLSYELAEELCEFSVSIRRELCLLVDFKGRVELVLVSDAASLDSLRELTPPPAGSGPAQRFCIQTQLSWDLEKPLASVGDQVTLLQYHFPLLITLLAKDRQRESIFSKKSGEHPDYCDAVVLLHPVRTPQEGLDSKLSEPMTARQAAKEPLAQWLVWSEEAFLTNTSRKTDSGKERALLMGLDTDLEELSQLAESAGAFVAGQITQGRRDKPDPRTYLGKGKAETLSLQIQQQQATLVIADDELSPAQQRTLETLLRVKVIDRTELILDIFAQRAQSREGKIQVALAQLKYLLPRLSGRGRMFSQQTAVGAKGGIATRGPGETKLETDRRVLQNRMTQLEREAEEVTAHRHRQRQRRKKTDMPVVALVGYTNAGKSTLMNALTKAGVLSEDKLFATLDPTTRQLRLPSGRNVLLSDTVGFIKKLPTFLIKAFRATLEEALDADVLLLVWDISAPDRLLQLETVEETLNTLGKTLGLKSHKDEETPPEPVRITVCNKIDMISADERSETLRELSPLLTHPVVVSANTREGLETLLNDIEKAL